MADRYDAPPAVEPIPHPDARIALWACDLKRRARDATRLRATLSSAERERAARFGTDALRDRWIAGRATLRELLARVLGVAPPDVPLRRGRRGRPEVAIDGAPDFNVSHTGGAAIVAIGIGLARGARIGVDIERADRVVAADRLARKFLTPREHASLAGLDADARRASFVRTWTFKEAMSKATADGLVAPFASIDIDAAAPRLIDGPPPYEPERWQLAAPDVGRVHLAALAIWQFER